MNTHTITRRSFVLSALSALAFAPAAFADTAKKEDDYVNLVTSSFAGEKGYTFEETTCTQAGDVTWYITPYTAQDGETQVEGSFDFAFKDGVCNLVNACATPDHVVEVATALASVSVGGVGRPTAGASGATGGSASRDSDAKASSKRDA